MIVSGKGMDLDDVLINFRLSGRYHILNILLTFIAGLSNALYCYNYVFVAEEVIYSCKYANTTSNDTCSQMDGEYSCREWEYKEPNSFVAEFNLACQEWKRTLVGSAHNFGYMIGLVIVGPLSDRIGRKATVVLTGVMGGVIGLARSFVTWYWLYVALEFLEAVIGDIYSPAYMMAVEIVATKKRILFIMFASFGFPTGSMIAALVGWGFPYWRTYLRVLYTPGLLFVVYWYLLQESPRWLLSKGKTAEATVVLKKACEMNNMKIDDKILEKLTYEDETKTINLIELFKITFSSSTILKRFLICVVWWVTSTFVNYGMTINSVTLQGNKYVNYAILGLLDIPGTLMIMYIMNHLKRKFSLIMCFFLGAAFCLIQPFVPTNLPWLSITLYMAGKALSNFYFEITYMYTSELFPTYTRNSMHALCSSLGRIGSIVAPQTPLLMAYWTGLPAIVYGSMALLAGVLTIFVPDTANNALPDTVAQAEALGRKVTGTEKDQRIKELDNSKVNESDIVEKMSECSRI